MIDPWLLEWPACPRCHGALIAQSIELICAQGHRYPVTDDIPVMLLDDVPQTHWVAAHALEHYREPAADSAHSETEIDPVV